MLSVEINKPSHFGKVLEVSQKIVENVVLEFSKKRLMFGDSERGGACLIFVEILKESNLFLNYSYTFSEKTKIIKIDIGSLKAKIARASKDHKVVLEYAGGNHLIVRLIGKSTKEFKIHLQEVSEGKAAFPKKASEGAHVKLITKPSLLEEAIGDLTTIKYDRFTFIANPDSIIFKTKKGGEEAMSTYPFTSDYFVGDQVVLEPVENMYSHEFLKQVVQVTKMSNYLNWKIVKGGPLLIGVQIAKDAYFWFFMISYEEITADETEMEEIGEEESIVPDSEADEDYDPDTNGELEEEGEKENLGVEDVTEFPEPGDGE